MSVVDLAKEQHKVHTLMPFSRFAGQNVRAEDGFGTYLKTDYMHRTRSVVFVFRTGELWSVDSQFIDGDRKVLPFLEPLYSERIMDYSRFLRAVGIDPPYKWECGISGAEGYGLQVPLPPGHVSPFDPPECVSNRIIATGHFDGNQHPEIALRPFFERVFEQCGVQRPTYLKSDQTG